MNIAAVDRPGASWLLKFTTHVAGFDFSGHFPYINISEFLDLTP